MLQQLDQTVIDVVSQFNQQVKQTTAGAVDLRLLVPAGLAALAFRQMLAKGLQLEEIPWYTLTWYAFDTFMKLNDREELEANGTGLRAKNFYMQILISFSSTNLSISL